VDLDHAFIRTSDGVGLEDAVTESVALRRQADTVTLPGEPKSVLVRLLFEYVARWRREHARPAGTDESPCGGIWPTYSVLSIEY
jgi:hypothetical protein